jgi:hypothetical protein
MRTVPRLILLGAFVLVNVVGAAAFFAAGSLARILDPSASESHLSAFIVAIIGVAAAVASAFPIFGRGVPWIAARYGEKPRSGLKPLSRVDELFLRDVDRLEEYVDR